MPDSTAAAAPPPPAGGDPSGRWQRLGRSPLRAVLTAGLGAAAGAAYAHFIGCRTGTCPLTSNVWTAGLYGAFVGAIVGWPNRRAERTR